MAEPGFKENEVKCLACGATFGTVGEMISHASSAHGVEVE